MVHGASGTGMPTFTLIKIENTQNDYPHHKRKLIRALTFLFQVAVHCSELTATSLLYFLVYQNTRRQCKIQNKNSKFVI